MVALADRVVTDSMGLRRQAPRMRPVLWSARTGPALPEGRASLVAMVGEVEVGAPVGVRSRWTPRSATIGSEGLEAAAELEERAVVAAAAAPLVADHSASSSSVPHRPSPTT